VEREARLSSNALPAVALERKGRARVFLRARLDVAREDKLTPAMIVERVVLSRAFRRESTEV